MFGVIYRFEIKEDREEQFISSWIKLTQLIRLHEGGLGSRLVRLKRNTYRAYAKWPDEETWKNSGNQIPPSEEEVKSTMRTCCESVIVENTLQIFKKHDFDVH